MLDGIPRPFLVFFAVLVFYDTKPFRFFWAGSARSSGFSSSIKRPEGMKKKGMGLLRLLLPFQHTEEGGRLKKRKRAIFWGKKGKPDNGASPLKNLRKCCILNEGPLGKQREHLVSNVPWCSIEYLYSIEATFQGFFKRCSADRVRILTRSFSSAYVQT